MCDAPAVLFLFSSGNKSSSRTNCDATTTTQNICLNAELLWLQSVSPDFKVGDGDGFVEVGSGRMAGGRVRFLRCH